MATSFTSTKRLLAALTTATGLALATSAAADPLQITIASPTVGGFPGPYAEVTYELVGTNQATFTFTATSPADSLMEGSFQGSATYANGWLTVSVPKTVITVPPGNSENWRNLTVRAFVATDYQRGNRKAVAQSRPVNVFRFLNFSATRPSERRSLTLEAPLSFLVPVPPGATASTARLAFEIEWVFVMGTFGDTNSRIAISGPIQSDQPFPESD
jgi:hypothetical protein